MNRYWIALAAAASTASLALSQSPYELEGYQRNEPRAFYFRLEYWALEAFSTVAEWQADVGNMAGSVTKGLHEELCQSVVDENLARQRTLNQNNPEELSLLHYNVNARMTGCGSDLQIGDYSAGHWLYLPGCGLTANINADQMVIPVEDISRFRLDVGLTRQDFPAGPSDPIIKYNDDIVIVPRTAGGFNWNLAEQVTLISIQPGGFTGGFGGPGGSIGNPNSGTITVARGQYGTTKRSFNMSNAWVAPHAHEGPWAKPSVNRLGWEYNFDPLCPTDNQGRQCADVLREELVQILENDPATNFFDGIQFDIARFQKDAWYEGRRIDLDMDGVEDHDDLAAQRRYGRGVLDFFQDLRDDLGPDRLILADSGLDDSQRGFGILNGMESEGFPDLWDVEAGVPQLDRWSTLINYLGYWAKHAYEPALNYVVLKDYIQSGSTVAPSQALARLAMAASVCTDSVFAYTSTPGQAFGYRVWDELDKGSGEFGWLGAPTAPTRRLGLETADQLFGLGAPAAGFQQRWTSSDASITQVNGQHLKIDPYFNREGARATVTNYVRMGGQSEVLVSVDLWADKMAEFQSYDVPRLVKCRRVGGPSGPTPPGTQLGAMTGGTIGLGGTPAEGVTALAGTDPTTVTFLMRDVPTDTFELNLEFEIEGDEPVYMANFRVHAASDWMARSFDNGAVLANPSDQARWFSIEALFPGRTFARINHRADQQGTEPAGGVPKFIQLPPMSGTFLVETSEPEAQFTAGVTYGDAPLTVDFSNSSTGSITSYHWSFGDGATSSDPEPSHSYQADGVYPVSLTVTGPGGSDTHVEHALVVVSDNIATQTFTHSPGFSSSPWSHFEWDGANYSPMSFPYPFHFFKGSETWSRIYRTYMVASGSESVTRWTVPGGIGNAPASVSMHVPYVRKRNIGGGDGTLFSIRENGSLVLGPRHVLWNDNSGTNATHAARLATGESLDVHLAERNDPGFDGTYVNPTVTMHYATAGPVASPYFTASPTVGGGPLTVQFTDRSFFGATGWQWDFENDGTWDSNAQNPQKTYATPGTYSVRLRVQPGGQVFVWDNLIEVQDAWTGSQGFPTSNPGGNQYGGVWSAWEWTEFGGYTPMNGWNSGAGSFQGSAFWSRIYATHMVAHGSNTVRAWRAPQDGIAHVAGTVRNGQTTCGDGVKVEIRHQNARVWGQVIMEAAATGTLEHDLWLSVNAGDYVYFHLDPRSSAGCDDAVWNPTITMVE